jgi:misacylated tRNA(Ala) deacylase
MGSDMTNLLFNEDSYLKSCAATVTGVSDRGGIILDRTVFYATGGGQPGDSGILKSSDGSEVNIATTVKGNISGEIIHVSAEGQTMPATGDMVVAELDWERRFKLMRMHTCLHLLSAVLPFPVTGGNVGTEKSRLDFDMDDIPDKAELTEKLNALIVAEHAVTIEWLTDDELAAQPELVKTMSVKPPSGAGRVRLLRIGDDIDLQPCGGTHLKHTGEIGNVAVSKIEKKGRQNRRVSIVFA